MVFAGKQNQDSPVNAVALLTMGVLTVGLGGLSPTKILNFFQQIVLNSYLFYYNVLKKYTSIYLNVIKMIIMYCLNHFKNCFELKQFLEFIKHTKYLIYNSLHYICLISEKCQIVLCLNKILFN